MSRNSNIRVIIAGGSESLRFRDTDYGQTENSNFIEKTIAKESD